MGDRALVCVLRSLRKCSRVYRSHISARKITTCVNKNARNSHNHETVLSDKKTHFGFETVSEREKEEKVYEVFHNVAEKYDVMNDSMSLGIHRLWKDHFIQQMAPVKGTKLLDVAGGTGDIAFRFLNYLKNEDDTSDDASWEFDETNPFPTFDEAEDEAESRVTVCDINQAMLDVGKKKAHDAGRTKGISWLRGNAECLPVADNSYDVYTIAFGIRNCTHIDKVLEEAYRVLRPGGRFMCLEFSRVNNSILRSVYDEYSFQVIPVLGQVIARDWKSYQYLVESIRKFPKQDDFADMLRSAGFLAVSYENLTFGVAAIHTGFKLK